MFPSTSDGVYKSETEAPATSAPTTDVQYISENVLSREANPSRNSKERAPPPAVSQRTATACWSSDEVPSGAAMCAAIKDAASLAQETVGTTVAKAMISALSARAEHAEKVAAAIAEAE